MKPSYYPKETRINDYAMEASHPWNLSQRCPKGSIPIERTRRNDHSTDSPSVSEWYMEPHYSLQQRGRRRMKDAPDTVYEHSAIQTFGMFYGGKASINVWNPKVENNDEFSVSQIWLVSKDNISTLEAGWMVYPQLNGGSRTRFFTYWTADKYQSTGCYNLLCPGFVQTNRRTILDTYLEPVSVYGGPQYSIDVEIFKDKRTGNWWLLLQGVAMGYWPNELVRSFTEGAGEVTWGGEVAFFKWRGQTSTQMGSGHFPYEGFKKSSFFKNMKVLDASYTSRDLVNTRAVSDSPKCYDLQEGGKKDGPWGYFFFYGGPGRS